MLNVILTNVERDDAERGIGEVAVVMNARKTYKGGVQYIEVTGQDTSSRQRHADKERFTYEILKLT